jgi:hypothetical protein
MIVRRAGPRLGWFAGRSGRVASVNRADGSKWLADSH